MRVTSDHRETAPLLREELEETPIHAANTRLASIRSDVSVNFISLSSVLESNSPDGKQTHEALSVRQRFRPDANLQRFRLRLKRVVGHLCRGIRAQGAGDGELEPGSTGSRTGLSALARSRIPLP